MDNPAALYDVLQRMEGRRVLLVGDFMLDRYVFGDADRISPEAPVPVLRVVERQDRVGGAGSVALCAAALGAQVSCFGALGADAAGDRVLSLLQEAGVLTGGLLRLSERPTTTKTRLVGLAEHRHRQQILRVDDEVSQPLTGGDVAALLGQIETALKTADVVCLEDYAKGVLTAGLCAAVIGRAAALRKPVLVDPPRNPHWDKFRGATLLTPNRSELEIGVGRALRDEELDEEAGALARRLQLQCLVVTLGREGARLAPAGGPSEHFPTRPRAVYDNTGAGDAVLAMMAVALAAGASIRQAVPLANIAGGLEVSKFGCVPIPIQEVRDELSRSGDNTSRKRRSLPDLLSELQARRLRGETVVFTNGCFDLLHPGHVDLLERAKALGSVLVVGLNSDSSVRGQDKGADRPVRTQDARARMLTALEAVDYVVLFDEPSVLPLVQQVRPDVLIKGGDYAPEQVVGGAWVRERGGRVVVLPFVEGFGTTAELARIRGHALA